MDGACVETLQVLELDNCPFITDHSLEMLKSVHSRRGDISNFSSGPVFQVIHCGNR